MPVARVKLKVRLLDPSMLFLFAFVFVAPVNAFWRHLCYGELATVRVDPIMAPGKPSQHAHVLFGASNLGLDPSIDDMLDSNCTSCSILQDKSAYWTPRMFFQYANGTFEPVATAGGMTVYYFTEGPGDGEPIIAFPQNFRMIAGDSLKRDFYGPVPDPPMAEWTGYDKTQQALMEKGIGFNCLHYTDPPNEGSMQYHYLRNKSFIDSTCTDGIRAELMFPSCWNGDLDSNNHTTHVAYPDQIKYGTCPDGYPQRLPTLFYETIYNTPVFNGIDGQFVFANGDPTGYGYHGDFLSGWEEGVLQAAIDDSSCTKTRADAGSGLQEDCQVFMLQDSYAATQCQMEIPETLQDEPVSFVSELPGNVKIQAGPERAVVAGHPSASSNDSQSSSTESTTSADDTTSFSDVDSTSTPATTTSSNPESAMTTDAPTMSDSNGLITTTTIFMSEGVEVEMVLVEEIMTVTASETATTNEHRKRHVHHHGHRERGRRYLDGHVRL